MVRAFALALVALVAAAPAQVVLDEATWCYGEDWCRELAYEAVPVEHDPRTWPVGVLSVAYMPGADNRDALGKLFFTGSETAEYLEKMKEVLNLVMQGDRPYPITTRVPRHQRTSYLIGHNITKFFDFKLRPINFKGMPPEFARPSVDVDVMAGQTVILKCKVLRAGSHPVGWFINNVILVSGSTAVSPGKYGGSSNGTFWIANASVDDSGEYVCKLGNIKYFQQPYVVTVLEPAGIINLKTEQVELEWKKSQQIHCNATGVPSPTITWLKRGVASILHRRSPLTIYDASPKDTGEYICIAYNGIGTRVLKTFAVAVQYPPRFHCEHDKSPGVCEARNVTIVCTGDSRPPPRMITVRLPFGQKIVFTGKYPFPPLVSSKYEASFEPHCLSFMFTILAITVGETGKYVFTVTNDAGSVSVVYHLKGTTSDIKTNITTNADGLVQISISFVAVMPAQEMHFIYRVRDVEVGPSYALDYDGKGQVIKPDFPTGSSSSVHKLSPFKEMHGWAERNANCPMSSPTDMILGDVQPDSVYDGIVQFRTVRGKWTHDAVQFRFYTGDGRDNSAKMVDIRNDVVAAAGARPRYSSVICVAALLFANGRV